MKACWFRSSARSEPIDIGLSGASSSAPGGMATGRAKRYLNAFNQISCLSFVGAVNFISLVGVETMTLYWWRPGGIGFGSRTDLTLSIYALLALDSETEEDPGSAELQ